MVSYIEIKQKLLGKERILDFSSISLLRNAFSVILVFFFRQYGTLDMHKGEI